MTQELTRAEHHIYGLRPDGSMSTYSIGHARDLNSKPNPINIWALKRQVPALESFLDLWAKGRLKNGTECAKGWLDSIFKRIEEGSPVPKLELQRAATLILLLSPGSYLTRLRQHLAVFGPCLTAQYRALLLAIDLCAQPKTEMIFHGCHPDIYLWIPRTPERTSKVIVCFGTRKNTLNAPRPLVHFELMKIGVALMYVGHRLNTDPAEGLLGKSLESSADLLKAIGQQHGLQLFYGLGTSLGGYAALHYASRVPFERVLNYSGAPDSFCRSLKLGETWLDRIDYPSEKVLTVFSACDPTDQKIELTYRAKGFQTHLQKVNASSHGSLTASIVEGRIQAQLRWLFDQEPSQTGSATQIHTN